MTLLSGYDFAPSVESLLVLLYVGITGAVAFYAFSFLTFFDLGS